MKALYPFQKIGVDFLINNKKALLADEMGLGKTVQIIELLNRIEWNKVLIVCPASLRLNWMKELELWKRKGSVVCLPDTKGDIFITSYASVRKIPEKLRAPDVLVLDESHYIKNSKAKRTKFILNGLKAKRIVCATGTPVLNRPIELYTTCKLLDRRNWPQRFHFGLHYCNGFKGKWGWDFTGNSNLDELKGKLDKFMLRRVRSEVLPELPEKRRDIVFVEPTGEGKALDAEIRAKSAIVGDETFEDMVKKLSAPKSGGDIGEIARLRRLLSLEKIDRVIEFLDEACMQKAVIFGWHREMLLRLHERYAGSSVLVLGGGKAEDKHAAVERFQNDKTCKYFFGSIKAAGVGLTLTAAHNVIFAESTWTPGDVTQAEDRCVRIGQKNDVLIQHILFPASIDTEVIKRVIEKQEVIDLILSKGETKMSDKLKLGLKLLEVLEQVDDLTAKGEELPKILQRMCDKIPDVVRNLMESSKFSAKPQVLTEESDDTYTVTENGLKKGSKKNSKKGKKSKSTGGGEEIPFEELKKAFITLAKATNAEDAAAIFDEDYEKLSDIPAGERKAYKLKAEKALEEAAGG